MKKLLTLLLIISFNASSQIYLKPTVYPSTPGNADGAFKVELMGYPGLVSYSVLDSWNSVLSQTDSLSNYDYNNPYAEIRAYAKDSLTGDTIAQMYIMNPGLLISLDISYLNQPQTQLSCDGVLQVDLLYDTIAYTGNMGMNYGPFQISGLGTWPDVCAEEGILNISNGVGFYVDMNVIVEPINVTNNTSFNAAVFSTISSETFCTTTSHAYVTGSTGPFSYSWNFGLFSSVDTISNLCPGYHNVRIIDNLNDTLSINFVSVDSSNAFVNYQPSPVIDTITFNTSNCSFNYNSLVDSIQTTYYEIINDSTFYFEMSIWQSGILTLVSDTILCYYSQVGYNLFSLTLYCQQKSGGLKTYQFIDFINMSSIANLDSKFMDQDLLLYPNPASEILSIRHPKYNHSIIYSLSGQKVLTTKDSDINISELNSGIYIISIFDKDLNSVQRKIVIN